MNALTRIPAEPGITSFTFDGHTIRIVHVDDEPRFIGTDVCKALKLSNPSVSIKALDPDEWSKIFLGHPAGEVIVLTESGLYLLIMRCQKALLRGSTAWRFRKLVTGKILPEIRRTGSYNAAPAPAPEPVDPMAFLSNPRNVMALLGQYAQRAIELEHTVARQSRDLQIAEHTIGVQAVTVEAHDRLTAADGALCVTDVAKVLGVSPSALFAYMRDPAARCRWFYRRSEAGEDVGWQDRLDAEELVEIPVTVPVQRQDGTIRDKLVVKLRVTPRGVTPRGVTRLARLIVAGKDPSLPVPADMRKVLSAARDLHLFD